MLGLIVLTLILYCMSAAFETRNPGNSILEEPKDPITIILKGLKEQGDCKYGNKGPSVRNTQKALIQLGYKIGGSDSDYGSKTETAIRAFQSKNGITENGVLKDTRRALIKALVLQSENPSLQAPVTPNDQLGSIDVERNSITTRVKKIGNKLQDIEIIEADGYIFGAQKAKEVYFEAISPLINELNTLIPTLNIGNQKQYNISKSENTISIGYNFGGIIYGNEIHIDLTTGKIQKTEHTLHLGTNGTLPKKPDGLSTPPPSPPQGVIQIGVGNTYVK